MELTVERVVEDCGTVVIFEGRDELDRLVSFACDHRVAQDLADAVAEGEAFVNVEGFQILHVGEPGADV